MNEDLFLIVGLGNPGPRFARHRHNVGFQVVDLLAQRHHLAFQRAEFRAAAASGTIGERRVLLAKPQTFMNLAGQAVAPLARFTMSLICPWDGCAFGPKAAPGATTA